MVPLDRVLGSVERVCPFKKGSQFRIDPLSLVFQMGCKGSGAMAGGHGWRPRIRAQETTVDKERCQVWLVG